MPGPDDQSHNQRIAITADFYDSTETAKLRNSARASEISALVNIVFSVPLAEFLTYYLFYKKRPGKAGFRNYSEISQKTDRVLSDLDDFVDVHSGTVKGTRASQHLILRYRTAPAMGARSCKWRRRERPTRLPIALPPQSARSYIAGRSVAPSML